MDKPDAPVLICLDYEAVAWNESGGNYEIVVPEEGTLSYHLGLLSDVPLTLEPGLDETLRLQAALDGVGRDLLTFPKITGRLTLWERRSMTGF